jgi:hypothetical protein
MEFALIAMVFLTFLGLCVYGRSRAHVALTEALRLRKLVYAAKATSIRDAPPEGSIVITGVATGADGAVVRAPFTSADVLWARASVREGVAVVEEFVRAVDAIEIDDGSGCVATVHLAGATVRITEQSLSGVSSERNREIAAFVASSRLPTSTPRSARSPSEFYSEAALRPGDRISVLATRAPADGAGYRESAASISLTSAAGGLLLLFDGAIESGAPKRHHDQIRVANVGIALFGFASAVSIALAAIAPR